MPTTQSLNLSKLRILRYRRSPDEITAKTSHSYQEFLEQSHCLRKSKKKRIKAIATDKKCTKEIPTNTAPPNPWITGGSIGSKDTVLLFRTSLLSNNSDLTESISDTTISSLEDCDTRHEPPVVLEKCFNVISEKISFKIDEVDEPNESKGNANNDDDDDDEEQNRSGSSSSDGESGLPTSSKKRPADSMSSSLSDQSLSSVSGDTADIESVIQNLSNSDGDNRKSNGVPPSKINSKSEVKYQPSSTAVSSSDNKENIAGDDEKIELPGTLLRMTYRFHQTETRLLRKILSAHGFTEVPEDEMFNLLWTGTHIKPDIVRNLVPYQRVNHFPRSYELTRKDSLHKNIEKMQHARGFKHFDIIPQSFILPHEYKDLVSAHNKIRGPWIVKPVALSRGRGIFIVNSPDQIPADEHVVVAKYIADPLCIDGHKCDIRIYVAVTSFDPLIIYIYEEGLVRIATVKYNRQAENLWNPCMHLCNYSINKYHSDYIKSSDADDEDVGHKWTFSALLRHLKNQGCDTEQLMLNIEDVIIKAIMSCAQPIVSACRMFVPNFGNCFELYGFDILIDDSLKPWLLEINLSPSLGIDTPLDAKVKAALLTDLMSLVGIPAIQPITKSDYEIRYNNRIKNGSTRRSLSVDLQSHTSSSSLVNKVKMTSLSAEEHKMVRMAKAQYSRHGGFVRVFPVADSLQKYGGFLDSITGIPTSQISQSGSGCPMIFPHNYNVMLHSQLYPNGTNIEARLEERMMQYERPLEQRINLHFGPKNTAPKCSQQARRLRKQIRKYIENGHELSQRQARKAFGLYLEHVLKRLATEPKHHHEKLILKFIQRANVNIKTPNFIRELHNPKMLSKDRGAMVAKQLGDFLQIYNRETEAYVDSFDRYGMVPIKVFNEFLAQADESDLESVLTLHTNFTKNMPFLYGYCSVGAPDTPPIPTGLYGFLKALPSMAPGGVLRDDARIDTFYKSINKPKLSLSRQKETATAGSSEKFDKPNKLTPLRKKK